MHLKVAAIAALIGAALSSPTPVAEAPQAAPPMVTQNPEQIPLKCYTHTTSLYPKTCPNPVTTLDCVVLPCIVNETRTMPCHTKQCAVTPTVTKYRPCTTTCRKGCETSTVYEKANCCN